ncbi:MAG: hypothetical protein JW829_20675 [Pirellulales bacterium]|nr:hypothetical protein [Pirellulales bacterium]
MTCKALVIEADPRSIESVNVALDSLEHNSDVVHSQSEALKRLKQNEYNYILCDIRIPARDGKTDSRIQNTENLLDKMSQTPDRPAPPIILMSDHMADGIEGTVDAMRLAMTMGRKGVVDIIDKNFPGQGRTLDRVIKKALGKFHGRKNYRPGRAVAKKMDAETEQLEEEKIKAGESPQTSSKPTTEEPIILTREQRDILQALSECPQETMLLVDIIAHAGYGKHATSRSIQKLIKQGLVHRPHGPRKGVALTAEGLAILNDKKFGRQVACQTA